MEYRNEGSLLHREYLKKRISSLRKIDKIYEENFRFSGIKVPLKLPIFYGIKYRVILKKAWEERLGEAAVEAVNAASESILFSGSEPRKCNVKEIKTHKDNSVFFSNNWYKKNQLGFTPISENEWKKLSKEAQKYFIKSRSGTSWFDEPIYSYFCTIPLGYCKNICENIYIINQVIDDAEKRSKRDWVKIHTNDFNDLYWFWNKTHPHKKNWREKKEKKYYRRDLEEMLEEEME